MSKLDTEKIMLYNSFISEINKFKTELKVEERKTNIDNRNSEKV